MGSGHRDSAGEGEDEGKEEIKNKGKEKAGPQKECCVYFELLLLYPRVQLREDKERFCITF